MIYKLRWSILSILFLSLALFVYFTTHTLKKNNNLGQIEHQAVSDCGKISDKKQCWEEKLEDILDKQGLNAGFDFVADLYEKEPEFAKDCHPYTHILGRYAYKKFYKRESISIGPKTSYCGYGFYHGFMEALIQDGRSPTEAKDFCSYIDNKSSGYTDKTITACYHGIGHGTVDGGDPRFWGNANALINPSLDLCKQISDDDEIRYLCATGVFNSLAIALNFGQYNLKSSNNPYDSCYNLQEDYFKRACYQEMNTHALNLAKNDFSKAAGFLGMILEKKYAQFAMEQLAGATIAYGNGDKDQYISTCKASIYEDACLWGLIGGILEHGKPNLEYVEAIEFCGNKSLSADAKDICYSRLVSVAGGLYPHEIINKICDLIPKQHRKLCPN